jgi:hypothetical protein
LGIDLVPEWEPEKDAYVDSVTSEELKRDRPTKGFVCSEIHDEKDISQNKEPAGGIAASTVHDVIGDAFDILPTTFTWILVLLVWLTLPCTNVEVIEDDINTFTGLIGGAVGKKTIGGATFKNISL